jgi:hypothetical protein
MNLRFRYRVGRFLSYFRRSHREEAQSLHLDDINDGSHLAFQETMRDVEMYSHESLWDIHDHPIVHEWRNRFLFMNRDLSALFAADGGGDGFITRMAINKSAAEIEKWNAACTMGISVEFQDEFTSFLQANITSYVHKRVSYVLACLRQIRGPSEQYIRCTYVDPWETLLGPDHVF